jgi:uncharacterized phage infection (PIP) family protein YhgE
MKWFKPIHIYIHKGEYLNKILDSFLEEIIQIRKEVYVMSNEVEGLKVQSQDNIDLETKAITELQTLQVNVATLSAQITDLTAQLAAFADDPAKVLEITAALKVSADALRAALPASPA